MYYTVEEYHIALDQQLQQLNSNRKLTFSKEQKDWFLNEAVLEFINTRSNPKMNVKGEGFEQSTERYEELEAIKYTIDIPVYKDVLDGFYCNFPSDFLKYISSKVRVFNNCNSKTVVTPLTQTIDYVVVPFKHDTLTTDLYASCKITINNAGTPVDLYTRSSSLPTIYSDTARYTIIRDVIEQIKSNSDYEIYYESWNSAYYKDSFIIVLKPTSVLTLVDAKLTYTGNVGTVINSLSLSKTYYNLTSNGTYYPSNLVSTEDTYNMDDNYYYKKANKVKPKVEIIDNRLVIKFTNVLSYCDTIRLNYLRLPRIINYDMNQTCELPFGEEIVSIAIRKIKARIADPNYKEIINETKITE